MGAVHKETPGQNIGYHEYESVTLSDERCVRALIRFKNLIYPEDREAVHFSEIMTAIYLDLEKLIKETGLSRMERYTTTKLMDGCGISDIAEELGVDRHTIEKYFSRAATKLAAKNRKQFSDFFERKYHNRLIG